jgi:hypothetical protein
MCNPSTIREEKKMNLHDTETMSEQLSFFYDLHWIEVTKLPSLPTLFQHCVAGYGDLEALSLKTFLKIWVHIHIAEYAIRHPNSIKFKGNTWANRHLLAQAARAELREKVDAEFRRRNLLTCYGLDICLLHG